jgi:hypothetical protein
LQSLITQEYFETLVPAITNKYVEYNSYDETNPQLSQTYENVISNLDDLVGENTEYMCVKEAPRKIAASLWYNCFPKTFKEISYGKNNYCTFELIIDILKSSGKKISANELKNVLFKEYQTYLDKYKDKILDILILEGKKILGNQVKSESISFSSFIYTDNYFLTPFDIWLLMDKYKIPCIFISPQYIFQTNYSKQAFVAHGNKEDKFVFIILSGLRAENVPQFKIIVNDEKNYFISLRTIKDNACFSKIEEAFREKISISDYLETFTKEVSTKYAKRKPILILEEEAREDEKENEKEQEQKIAEKTDEKEQKPEEQKKEKVITIKKPRKKIIIQEEMPIPDILINVEKKKKHKNITKGKTRKTKIKIVEQLEVVP